MSKCGLRDLSLTMYQKNMPNAKQNGCKYKKWSVELLLNLRAWLLIIITCSMEKMENEQPMLEISHKVFTNGMTRQN